MFPCQVNIDYRRRHALTCTDSLLVADLRPSLVEADYDRICDGRRLAGRNWCWLVAHLRVLEELSDFSSQIEVLAGSGESGRVNYKEHLTGYWIDWLALGLADSVGQDGSITITFPMIYVWTLFIFPLFGTLYNMLTSYK